LTSAKRTIESQAATIQELKQQLLAVGGTKHTIDIAVDTSETKQKTGTVRSKQTNRQPQRQPPPPGTSQDPTNTASISGFEKLTVDLNELEDFITGGTNVIIEENGTTTTTAAAGAPTNATATTEQQPIITPVSARDRIAAFEKASREAILLQQNNSIGNKSPELASQCKITAAARAGSDLGSSSGGGGGGKGKRKNKGKPKQTA
jgi:hypothetical protein